MKKLIIPLIATSLYFSVAHAQAPPDFAAFADTSHAQMIAAYQHRDIPGYRRLLDNFITRWNDLDSASRKTYAGYRIDALYNLACTYALVNQPGPALDCFERSIRAGFTNYTHVIHDDDLVSLHNSPRYRALLAPLREVGDYPYILEKGARYDPDDHRALPAFQYQAATDTNLIALRKGLNLDSIAGSGSDVNRVIRLLHWMHDLIPHDGNHANPAVRNAMSLVAVCKREHRGLNCRGLAIALNECYLALGYRSRYVTCMPKDSLGTDPDCHVINTVYIPSLKKWIWIDPTNDAYVMNEKGDLLSIEEVRLRLITHQPLVVNPDANWNHRAAVTKEDYLGYYMSKNLYRLICPVNSAYDLETAAPGKEVTYIQLLPLDYFRQKPGRAMYNTNNPTLFWATPN
ncbi:MAG TPA: transglutaminase domain-containing protein [Puia sp.]|uniref:TPR end-of-group domain-containing protein n=1 Tax=Puia sp. TaxID=2045100 RepID=UPI002CA10140|nr:transglutaminase domain-containing protein [Puia sp.]HVU97822.1 transglutaminase domain-containing protein [Puia sp.]